MPTKKILNSLKAYLLSIKPIKKILFLFVSLSSMAYGQQCEIINSITLSANTTPIVETRTGMGYLNDSTGNSGLFAGIDTSKWHYVVYTKAANLEGKIYIDGLLAATGAFQNWSYSYSSLYLAASYYTSWSGFFKGWVDEFRMSNKVRTASEISAHYASNAPFTTDANTIGLWHFDEASGTTYSNVVGGNGDLYNGASFTNGKFGNAVYFDGIDDRGNCNLDIPESDITFEFWVKLDGATGGTIIQPYGMYSSNIHAATVSTTPSYLWSTGDTTNSVTIDPSVDSLVWVSNGTCTDTVYFNNDICSQTIYDTVIVNDTTFITVTDTNYVTVTDTNFVTVTDTNYVTVTDTLIINAQLTGVAPPNNINTLSLSESRLHPYYHR